VFFGDAQAYPEGCAAVQLVGEACDAAVEAARVKLGLDLSAIEAIDILTEDRCGEARELLCTRSTAFIAGVRFTLKEGSIVWTTVACVPGMKAIYCGPPDP
jgi:hypothetical protein